MAWPYSTGLWREHDSVWFHRMALLHGTVARALFCAALIETLAPPPLLPPRGKGVEGCLAYRDTRYPPSSPPRGRVLRDASLVQTLVSHLLPPRGRGLRDASLIEMLISPPLFPFRAGFEGCLAYRDGRPPLLPPRGRGVKDASLIETVVPPPVFALGAGG